MEPGDPQIAPEQQQEMTRELIQREGYSEFTRGGVSVHTSKQEGAEYTKRGNVYVVERRARKFWSIRDHCVVGAGGRFQRSDI